jgi:LacI family transcriptional regulator
VPLTDLNRHDATTLDSTPSPRVVRVALLVESASSWGADLLKGIAEFSRSHAELIWSCYWEPWGKNDRILLPEGIEVDGVIARVTHEALAKQLVASQLPVVNLSWYRFPGYDFPSCNGDAVAAGEMAADYLVSLGYRHFAYCPANERHRHPDQFGDAFIDALAKRQFGCDRYEPADSLATLAPWFSEVNDIEHWLKSLPLPIAILAFHDLQARMITEACTNLGLRVPQDIAVMGGERDEISSRLSRPPITSIDQSVERIGFEAARLLDGMMRGLPAPTEPLMIAPARIVPRQSTDWLAVDDDLVARALAYIRQHMGEPIDVRDIVDAVKVSRRTLEQRFRRLLGRSPADELRRARARQAAKLLCETRLPVVKIAAECGFEHPETLSRCFQREFQTTPAEFRRRHKRP